MEDTKYFQMFLYSLVNLISFLLSVIFLTSLSNIVNQTKLTGLNDMYDSDYYSSYARRSEVAYHANGMGQSATDGGEVRTVADSVYVFPIL